MRHRSSGFTLIELLVVVSILGLLAALLFPIFATARHQANVAVCMSNLRQLGLALQMYEADNRGDLPPHQPHYPDHYFPIHMTSYDPLKPYVGASAAAGAGHAAGIYECPEARGTYNFRFFINLASAFLPPSAPTPADMYERYCKHIRPGPNTVVTYCASDVDWSFSIGPDGRDYHKGFYLVVRNSGAVGRVSPGQIVQWAYKDGKWDSPSPEIGPPIGTDQFPDEPWPPDLYCNPGECLSLPH